jgi:hypothetical protein
MKDAEKRKYSDNPQPEHAGVEATKDVLRWLWDSGFAAIASDAISWEVRFDPFYGLHNVCGNFTESPS